MIKITQEKLPNGLKVVYIQHHNLSGAVATLFVRAGSAFESDQNRGISHLVEHLIFSRNKKAQEFFPLNLELDARTRKDFCYFEISHHRDLLEQMIRVIFSAVFGGKFSQRDLETQKNVIAQEIHERDEDPFVVLSDQLEKNMYANGSWASDVLGSEKSVRSINLERVENWKNKFYQTDNMVLAISGGFDKDEIHKVVESLSDKISNTQKTLAVPLGSIKYNRRFDLRVDLDKFDQTYLGLAFATKVQIGDPDYFKLLLLSDVLGRQLQLELKDVGSFYDVDLYFHHYLVGGEVRIITSVERGEGQQAATELIKLIQDLKIEPGFFEKIKELSAKSFSLRADQIDDLASIPLYELAQSGKLYSPEEEAEKISEIKFDEIVELKEKILTKDNCNVIRLS